MASCCFDAAGISQSDGQRFQGLLGSLEFSYQAMAHEVSKRTEERREQAAKAAEEAQKKAQEQQK